MLHHKHENNSHSLEPLRTPNAKNITRIAVQEAPVHAHSHTHYTSLNLKAAAVHAIGDFIQSIGVLIASITIWIQPNWVIVDPVCTLIFCLLVFVSTWIVALEVLHILMEGTPAVFELGEIESSFLQVCGVASLHELHVWTLKPGIYALTVHVVIQEASNQDWEKILIQCQKVACQQHGIHHTVVQIERGISYSHCKPALCSQG
jgi:zinc transporter 2